MAWSSGLQLRVTGGNDEGRVIPLNSPEITLGRAVESNQNSPGWVLFSEPTVSRIHALMQWSDELQCYILQHRSRTNPTLVDGAAIESHPLQMGETVGLGLLEFVVEQAEVRTGKLGDAVQTPGRAQALADPVFAALNNLAEEKSREHMAGIADLVDAGMGRSEDPENAFRLVVAQGPDQGQSFVLNEPVLIIGRRQGPGDPRASAGVLLHDVAVPPEQAVLVWQDRPASYGILQSDESKLPTRIRRITNGVPKEIIVRCDTPTVLNERDVLMMGKTALIVRRGLEDRIEQNQGRRQQRAYSNQPRQSMQSPSYNDPPQAPVPAPGYAPAPQAPVPAPGYAPAPRGAELPAIGAPSSRSPLRSWKGSTGDAVADPGYGYPPEPPVAPGYAPAPGYNNRQPRGGYPQQPPAPEYGGWPAQGYGDQGYPPQQGGYPEQGYPQRGGYPDQGYAPQPQPGYDPRYDPRYNQDYPQDYDNGYNQDQPQNQGYDPRYDPRYDQEAQQRNPQGGQPPYYGPGAGQHPPVDPNRQGPRRPDTAGYPPAGARASWQGDRGSGRGQYAPEQGDYYPDNPEGDLQAGNAPRPQEQALEQGVPVGSEPSQLADNLDQLPAQSAPQRNYPQPELNETEAEDDYQTEGSPEGNAEVGYAAYPGQAQPAPTSAQVRQAPVPADPSYAAQPHDGPLPFRQAGDPAGAPLSNAIAPEPLAPEQPRPAGSRPFTNGASPRPVSSATPPAPPNMPPAAESETPSPGVAPVENEEQYGENPAFNSGEFGNSTNSWQYRSDYVIVYQAGNRKGQKVALLASEINDERAITIGTPGTRINDIEVDEPTIANDQAVLRYGNGRFSIINFRSDILVNKAPITEGEQVILMTGDQIQLGNTVLVFLERRSVEILRAYCLEVVDGIESDLHKRFNLKRERMTIGRDRGSNIKLADQEVSRNHCALVLRGDKFYIQHRSDTNPTFINGISVLPGAERQVSITDRIQVSSRTVLQLAKKK